MGKIADCVCLSILWVFFSLPLVTAGAATTALYYTCNKALRERQGYIWRNFIDSFKSNFKQSTCVWVVMLLIFGVLLVDFNVLSQLIAGNNINLVFLDITVVFACVFLTWTLYIMAYIARFENRLKTILKNTFFIMGMNLGWSFLVLIIALLGVVVMSIVPISIFVLPAVIMLSINLILERVFGKYRS